MESRSRHAAWRWCRRDVRGDVGRRHQCEPGPTQTRRRSIPATRVRCAPDSRTRSRAVRAGRPRASHVAPVGFNEWNPVATPPREIRRVGNGRIVSSAAGPLRTPRGGWRRCRSVRATRRGRRLRVAKLGRVRLVAADMSVRLRRGRGVRGVGWRDGRAGGRLDAAVALGADSGDARATGSIRRASPACRWIRCTEGARGRLSLCGGAACRAAVQRLARDLGDSRAALGDSAGAEEIAAGAERAARGPDPADLRASANAQRPGQHPHGSARRSRTRRRAAFRRPWPPPP